MPASARDNDDLHRIVFLDRATIAPHITVRKPAFPHVWRDYERTRPDEVVERARDATILVVNKVVIGDKELAALPRLRLIALAATGTNNIDLDACRSRGITVTNIRGYATATVPEHTFALILALRRSLIGYRQDVIGGEWERSGLFCFFTHPVEGLAGHTLGIIGAGALGRAVADIGRGFGMRVLFSAHKGADDMGSLYTPFETVLAESDVITLHCPLTPKTRNLIGPSEFAKMSRKPVLVNTARGGLVDEDALVEALERGLISGAGFDVVTTEPMPADHPFRRILSRPDFILTPHVGWAATDAMQTLADQLIDILEAFAEGRTFNTVVP